VDAELAVIARAGLEPTVDPLLFTINVVIRAGCELAEVEAALDVELELFSSSPINKRELDMTLSRARAQFVMAGESITGQAHIIGMAEAAVDDYRWYESTVEKLSKVTLDDLERVRRTYLTKKNRTVGWYQPEKIKG